MWNPFSCCSAPRIDGSVEEGGLRTAPNRVELGASEIGGVPGFMAYHTSVAINGEELFFSNVGIVVTSDWESHSGFTPQISEQGYTSWTASQLKYALDPYFLPGTYDLLIKNCNSFTEAALFVITRVRLDPKYSAAERMGSRSASLVQQIGPYTPNHRAANFSFEGMKDELTRLRRPTIVRMRTSSVSPGAWVKITGLKSEAGQALNNRVGRVMRENPDTGRWEVLLGESDVKAVKPENLNFIKQPEEVRFTSGTQVRIHGLLSEAAQVLNGSVGMVVGIAASGRCEVQLQGSPILKAIRASNLTPV